MQAARNVLSYLVFGLMAKVHEPYDILHGGRL
jgi:hypothetical protein